MITAAIKSGVVPMIKGSPGTGKSQIVYQIAKDYNLFLIDLRLSQCDPTDLSGFPEISQIKTSIGMRNRADYAPMAHFPIEGDTPPPGYSGWLLFLDELTSAKEAIQAASYKLILDRMIGTHRLHKNCAIVAAGNLETDGAIVYPMSTALKSRMLHLEVVVDVQEWLDWAAANLKNHSIPDYVKFKPGNIYTFSADHTDDTYACPRTYEFADRLVTTEGMGSQDILPLLAGTLSEGIAREYIQFCKIYDRLLKPEQIAADPMGVTVPSEPSILWALTGSISHNITEANAKPMVTFISRMSHEMQMITMREVVRKHKHLKKNQYVAKWVAESSMALF